MSANTDVIPNHNSFLLTQSISNDAERNQVFPLRTGYAEKLDTRA